ncbi:MAG: hypothetical protein J7L50_02030 [Candidatus Odinarchaeota archaeon]|nr:hypothetical protein [Candidatus Odinarchaeota archaeon]
MFGLSVKKLSKIFLTHVISSIVVILSLYSSVLTLPYVLPPKRLLHYPLLYGLIVTLILDGLQVGVQLASLVEWKDSPILLLYYFQYDPDEEIPHIILDPTKSIIGVLSLLSLLLGGYILWPFYFILGLIYAYNVYMVSDIPSLIPKILDELSRTISPLMASFFMVWVISILVIEKRYISK